MLKKMRRRVILAAMLAFFAVITMIGVLVNLVNYGLVTSMADQTLSAILSFEEHSPKAPGPGEPPREPFRGLPDMESNYMTRFFAVRFDENENAVFVSMDYIASVDSEKAVEYAKQILKRGNDHGYLKEYRFAKYEVNGITIVVFLNTFREQQSMKALFILTLAVSAVSLIIVFVLVTLFSGRAIRPIANNIKQQKQFITDASHELKTPLTSISTSVDVLEMEHGEDEWLANIRSQAGRMSKLVSELVTLSRLDEINPLPNKEEFSLSNAAWEIVEVYEPQAKASGKNLVINIQDDVSMVGEKAAIQQMLSVLLDNAVRYSDENADIRFDVNKKKNRINIEVFNTCERDIIPDEERLFDRFYRPDDSRNSKTGGSGVGLAIAKAVTETHGGVISASCPSGKSMTIKVKF
ncbi:MAG: HAMP domain-containing histidine kinase [Lachnospiraceae bacterium]|nr:HAMP domain-containing histidine kinase [Lachnospiraceae bacterium]